MDPDLTDDETASDGEFLRRVAATPSTRGVEGLVSGALSAVAETHIGGYEVRGRIGAGGMGVVLAARDPRLERDVALKLLRPGKSGTHARLLREARALARLSHPNVVAIHEVGTHAGGVFVAMEYVRGQTFREWMRTSPSLHEIAGAFAQAARGLRAAHRERIVHRDFKPDNVIIGDDGRVRVLDFGVASTPATEQLPTDAAASRPFVGEETTAGHVRGTIQYMPPEQRNGYRVGPPADVHAFCVSLYEVLHGHRPELEPGLATLSWRRDLPRSLVTAIRRGLHPDAARRSNGLDELVAVLDDLATHRRALPRTLLATAGGLSIAGLVAALIATRPDTPPVAEDATSSTVAHGLLVCPADNHDPRSCAELFTALSEAGGIPDDATRCAYRRACTGPVECPSGTQPDGTLGCAFPICDEPVETVGDICLAADGPCCLTAANVAYAEAPDTPDPQAVEESGLHFLRAACDAGDGLGCFALGKTLDDERAAIQAFATGCELGNVQSCRRVATLPDAGEVLDAACGPEVPTQACRSPRFDRAQLAYFAACGTIVQEVPTVAGDSDAVITTLETVWALRDGEASGLRRAFDRFEEDTEAELRALWLELLGEDAPELLTWAELDARLGAEAVSYPNEYSMEYRRAVYRLADERGSIPSRLPTPETGPLDRFVRLSASLGDRLEQAVATELGPERAAELRKASGGWPGSRIDTLVAGTCPRRAVPSTVGG